MMKTVRLICSYLQSDHNAAVFIGIFGKAEGIVDHSSSIVRREKLTSRNLLCSNASETVSAIT